MLSETVQDTFENNDERQLKENASAQEPPEMAEAEKEYWNRKRENARQRESRV